MMEQPRYRTLGEVYVAHMAGDIEKPRVSCSYDGSFCIYAPDSPDRVRYLWHASDIWEVVKQALEALSMELDR